MNLANVIHEVFHLTFYFNASLYWADQEPDVSLRCWWRPKQGLEGLWLDLPSGHKQPTDSYELIENDELWENTLGHTALMNHLVMISPISESISISPIDSESANEELGNITNIMLTSSRYDISSYGDLGYCYIVICHRWFKRLHYSKNM